MQANYLKQALDTLGKSHFNKLWPDDSVKLLAYEVVDISDKAMVETVKRIRLEISPSTFPPLSRIKEILQAEQKKINMSTSPDEPLSRRDNDKQWQASKFGEGASEYNKRAADFCIKIADGLMTLENQIKTCEMFEKTYPGVGWQDTLKYLLSRARTRQEELCQNTTAETSPA